MKKWQSKLVKIAEDLGWSVKIINNEEMMFQKYSPAGQDFFITIEPNDFEDAVNLVHERVDGFDCSEETYYWLDNTGHGTNGAPNDMRDLYNDMEACLKMLEELYEKLYEESIKE